MKYEVVHTLSATLPDTSQPVTANGAHPQKTHTFKPGEFVTEADLKEWGFDLKHLLDNKSVEALKGTEEDATERRKSGVVSAPTTTSEATPHMATAPLAESDSPPPETRKTVRGHAAAAEDQADAAKAREAAKHK